MAFYDNLKLEKGMYNLNFTKTLEELDPSENYEGTELEGLDAYERQLNRFGIRISGQNSDTVESFFKATDSAVLFPEYVRRAVKKGMEESNTLSSIVATVTNINGNDYRTIVATDDSNVANATTEGSNLPATTINQKGTLVTMKKRGRLLKTSFEALRLKRLDLFTVTLKQIGAYIARAQLGDAVSVLVSGDNGEGGTNSSEAAETVNAVSSTGVDYADLLALWSGLLPYKLNTIIADAASIKDLLSIQEMADAQAGLTFQGSGQMITPLGANLICASDAGAKKLIGMDRTCALEMVTAGDLMIDCDKLIDAQLEKASISSTAGFAKIFNGAVKTLTYNATT